MLRRCTWSFAPAVLLLAGSTLAQQPRGEYSSVTPSTVAEAHPTTSSDLAFPFGAPAARFSDPDVEPTAFDADLNAPTEEVDRISALENRFNDFVKGATGTTYPTVKINGVFQADFGWIGQDNDSIARYGRIKNGADFRRARIAASGAITEVNNYFFQMDFAFAGHPTFTDLWVEQTDLPILGNVRAGQWKQPFSLEVVSSFRYTTFAERSVLFQPFTPFRHLGVGFYDRNTDLTATWAGSVFAAGQDQFGGSIATAGGVGTSGRFTWLPVYDELSDGRYYLHLGGGHYFSAPNDHGVNFRTIPELYIGQFAAAASAGNQQPVPTNTAPGSMPFFVATGNIPTSYYNVVGSELLWVRGPWSLQSEAMVNRVNRLGADDVTFWGFYSQVGYFLTGEHRPYDRKAGAIDRIKPFENFFRVPGQRGRIHRGSGAWEIAGRVSYLDLNDKNIRGGTLTDLTAGLNWYCNPYMKWQLNYIHAYSTDAASILANTDMADLRLQIDF